MLRYFTTAAALFALLPVALALFIAADPQFGTEKVVDGTMHHLGTAGDPEWREFSDMTKRAACAIRVARPALTTVLGGLSPIDPHFARFRACDGRQGRRPA